MVTKRDDYEDEEISETADERKGFSLGLSTIILWILFLILCEMFLYFLSTKTNSSFGLKGILLGFLYSLTITLFFSWTRYLMQSNKYLGVVIGISGTGLAIFALTRVFSGPYTTTFIISGMIISLGYLLVHFIKTKPE